MIDRLRELLERWASPTSWAVLAEHVRAHHIARHGDGPNRWGRSRDAATIEVYRQAMAVVLAEVSELQQLLAAHPHLAAIYGPGYEIEDAYTPRERAERVCHVLAGLKRGRADKSADTSAKKSIRVPSNPDVLRLAKRLATYAGRGRSEREIALEYTEGNKKRAETLLRLVRRLRASRK